MGEAVYKFIHNFILPLWTRCYSKTRWVCDDISGMDSGLSDATALDTPFAF